MAFFTSTSNTSDNDNRRQVNGDHTAFGSITAQYLTMQDGSSIVGGTQDVNLPTHPPPSSTSLAEDNDVAAQTAASQPAASQSAASQSAASQSAASQSAASQPAAVIPAESADTTSVAAAAAIHSNQPIPVAPAPAAPVVAAASGINDDGDITTAAPADAVPVHGGDDGNASAVAPNLKWARHHYERKGRRNAFKAGAGRSRRAQYDAEEKEEEQRAREEYKKSRRSGKYGDD